jgi:hypothetical protein
MFPANDIVGVVIVGVVIVGTVIVGVVREECMIVGMVTYEE